MQILALEHLCHQYHLHFPYCCMLQKSVKEETNAVNIEAWLVARYCGCELVNACAKCMNRESLAVSENSTVQYKESFWLKRLQEMSLAHSTTWCAEEIDQKDTWTWFCNHIGTMRHELDTIMGFTTALMHIVRKAKHWGQSICRVDFTGWSATKLY